MSTPDWLRVGTALRDEEGERWLIRSVDASRVEVQHPDRGAHGLRRSDLIDWVEADAWTVSSVPPE